MAYPTVIVPFRGGCPDREAAWAWVRDRYSRAYPAWTLAEAAPAAGPWVKASAVMPAVREAEDEIVIVADADVWCDGLEEAVAEVEAGAPWAVPHGQVYRLNAGATADVLAAELDPLTVERPRLTQKPYRGYDGGGIVVVPRDIVLSVPMDHRFTGWGQEDDSWGHALRCLVGPPWRRSSDRLIHLWHPPEPRVKRKMGTRKNWALFARYHAARRDPVRMRELINEVSRCPLTP